jgi:alpha-tubulin suppressor-like RCC1 family protein
VPSLTLTTMALGVDHTCGRTTAGETYCWGRNNNAQLGNGTTSGSLTAQLVSGGHAFAKIFASADHTCGLTAAGAAWCWGYNNFGQLGDGSTTSRSTPTLVQGGFVFSQLALGGTGWDGITIQPNHTCGTEIGGGARCWGRNASGQLGDGTTTDRLTPTAVALP